MYLLPSKEAGRGRVGKLKEFHLLKAIVQKVMVATIVKKRGGG